MKKLLTIAVAASAFAAMPVAAQTTTLTFDALSYSPDGFYGDGAPLGPTTSDGQTLSYAESGYVLTLHTTNTPNSFFGAHIGDAGNQYTFNWHDDGDNEIGAFVTLARANGGLFDLNSFDFASLYGDGLTVSGGANAPLYFLNASGNSLANFTNVSSVTFASTGYNYNQLDNIVVASATGAVPEPATWAMMVLGFGMVGFGLRSRTKTKQQVRVTYA